MARQRPNLGSSSEPIPATTTERLHGSWDHLVATSDGLESVISNAGDGDVIALEAGTHTISTPLKTSKRVKITSAGLNVKGGEWDPNSKTADEDLADWSGPAIEQQSAGTDIIHFGENEEAQQVIIEDVLLTWESSIRNSDTGHAVIFDAPPDPDTSYKLNGVYQWELNNVAVYGHDGDHYAFKIINSLQGKADKVQTYGGGGWHWINEHSGTNMGNAVVTDSYTDIDTDGSAHGIELEHRNGILNFITFLRPQVNSKVTPGTGQQHVKVTDSGGTAASGIHFISSDFEGTDNGMDLPDQRGSQSSTFLPQINHPTINTPFELINVPNETLRIGSGTSTFEKLKTEGGPRAVELDGQDDNLRRITYVRDTQGQSMAIRFRRFDMQFEDHEGGAPFIFSDQSNAIERFRIGGKGWGNSHIENLSGQTGDFDGQHRLDDGTNTPHRAVDCVWDDVNGVWVDQTDGTTFT